MKTSPHPGRLRTHPVDFFGAVGFHDELFLGERPQRGGDAEVGGADGDEREEPEARLHRRLSAEQTKNKYRQRRRRTNNGGDDDVRRK